MEYFNCHTHTSSGDLRIWALVNQYPASFDPQITMYSIGIHPWHIGDNWREELAVAAEMAALQNCLAVGECGLDKRTEIPFALQEEAFRAQLEIAERLRKPVIIHCVAAFAEVIAIRRDMRIEVPMIIHGFSKNIETANQLLNHGFYLSFGKYLLRNPGLGAVLQQIPADRFFLETDTITESIMDVYQRAANCRGITVAALQEIIERNFNAVFTHTQSHSI